MGLGKRVMVTGIAGFIGVALVKRLQACGYDVIGIIRKDSSRYREHLRKAGCSLKAIELHEVGNIDGHTGWDRSFGGAGVDVVVHLAARAHVRRERSANALEAFRETNVDGTRHLAEQAAASGVGRFVYLSSIKVNGGVTTGQPFRSNDEVSPQGPYGQSKAEAEKQVRRVFRETSGDFVTIRPPLVYGPGVKANFLNLMRWLYLGIPLPLGAIENRRSLVALDNLVDLIVRCLEHPGAANQTLLVSDGEDLSTTALLQRTAAAMGKSARLVPVPALVVKTAASLLGKPEMAERLCDSLQVETGKTRELLNWSPPMSVDEALSQTVRHFLTHQRV